MVEQQKIDIEEESTTTATGIKKETKEQRQQELSRAEETQQQDNAAGVETKDLNDQGHIQVRFIMGAIGLVFVFTYVTLLSFDS